jgi:hypothetical protein
MLASAQSLTRQTVFTFESPELTIEDAPLCLLLKPSFGHCSIQWALVAVQKEGLS